MERASIKDIIQWDISNWSEGLRFWEHTINWGDPSKNCLELGADSGGLSLWLALKGYHVLCSDLANTRARASPLHKKYGAESLISYQDIDATDIRYRDSFDVIVFKSVLGKIGTNGGVEKQQRAMDEVLKALRPGGQLLFAENLVATGVHRFLRERFAEAGRSWRYITLSEMRGFLRSYSSFEIHATGVIGAFGRTEAQRDLLSAIDRIILNRIVPENWKYLVYGIAVK